MTRRPRHRHGPRGTGEPERGAADLAAAAFRSVHGRDPAGVFSAPGRVNLIGEHTDYNDGYVLPFALPHRIAAAVAPRTDTRVTVATRGSDGRLQHATPVDLHRLRPGEPGGWASYVAGVVWAFRAECGLTHGADLVIAGTVPSGAGLSSSAALECAVALALADLTNRTDRTDRSGASPSPEPDLSTRRRLARLAQRAENEFVGVPTGALDQTAALCCVTGHALFFDVGTGALEQIPFDTVAAGLRVLVLDTRVRHALGDSDYGDRRKATAAAARMLGLGSLREIAPDRLHETLARLPDELAPLVAHVVSENARVLDVVRHLKAGRPADIGHALNASHDSLRDDYRVSCPELDLAVGAARSAGALGARMTGGGFGGSALALVRADDAPAVRDAVAGAFRHEGLRTPRLYTVEPSPGAGRDGPAPGGAHG